MKRKDWLILGGVAALAGLLLLGSLFIKPKPDTTKMGTLTLKNLGGIDQSKAALDKAESFLRIKQGEDYYQLVPLNAPGEIVIRQEQGYENVIHIGHNSVVMHSANCPKHECIAQGEMTLDNIDTRVFFQWITCLPHQLSLELLPRKDALHLLSEQNP